MNKRNLIHIQELIDTERGWGGSVGELSDGYHTFNELYEHRIALYIQLLKSRKVLAPTAEMDYKPWRTVTHSDGSVWDGWFILGLGVTPGEQITYHLPMSKWNECDFAEDVATAPEWDGHTSADVLKRLKNL